MKSKDRVKKVQQKINSKKSSSRDKINKKYDYNSMIFQSERNSLASPKAPFNINLNVKLREKHKLFHEFINTGLLPQLNIRSHQPQHTRRNSLANNQKGRSMTPPRRLSSSLTANGRKSLEKQKHLSYHEGQENLKKHQKKKSSKSPALRRSIPFIEQQITIKSQPLKSQINKKDQQKKSKNKKACSKKNHSKDQREKQLISKLFKDIQFYRDLGKGTHAIVKSGVDWVKKRKIAVKIYEKEELKENELKNINKEYEILQCMEHKNIIKLYERIQSIKKIHLIMEYGGGNSVEQYIHSKETDYLSEEESRPIFRQILEAVCYLHSKNIAHRDIKTDNLLLNKHLHLKLIDFGYSVICHQGQLFNTYCGTPTFMAPEIVTKTPYQPQLSDLWSLGVLLYIMLCGHTPFKAQTQKQLYTKIAIGDYSFNEEENKRISQEGQRLIENLMQINPESRISAEKALNSAWFEEE